MVAALELIPALRSRSAAAAAELGYPPWGSDLLEEKWSCGAKNVWFSSNLPTFDLLHDGPVQLGVRGGQVLQVL